MGKRKKQHLASGRRPILDVSTLDRSSISIPTSSELPERTECGEDDHADPLAELRAAYYDDDDDDKNDGEDGLVQKTTDDPVEAKVMDFLEELKTETNALTHSSVPLAPWAVWQEACDVQTGATYYWNVSTRETRWNRPSDAPEVPIKRARTEGKKGDDDDDDDDDGTRWEEVETLSGQLLAKLRHLLHDEHFTVPEASGMVAEIKSLVQTTEFRLRDWHEGGVRSRFFAKKLVEGLDRVALYDITDVPAGWARVPDEAGRPYYLNLCSGQSTWEKPDARPPPPPPPPPGDSVSLSPSVPRRARPDTKPPRESQESRSGKEDQGANKELAVRRSNIATQKMAPLLRKWTAVKKEIRSQQQEQEGEHHEEGEDERGEEDMDPARREEKRIQRLKEAVLWRGDADWNANLTPVVGDWRNRARCTHNGEDPGDTDVVVKEAQRGLPPNWTAARGPDGDIYYANLVTRESSWERPNPNG